MAALPKTTGMKKRIKRCMGTALIPRYARMGGTLSEKEAMEISGHKTRSVFDRYHIVSDRRMKQNALKLEEHLRAMDEEQPKEAPGRVN